MSWGERSCEHLSDCGYEPTLHTCNVYCSHYESNGRRPNSGPRAARFVISSPGMRRVDIGPPLTADEIARWRRQKAHRRAVRSQAPNPKSQMEAAP